jgi:hypothetical protein
MGPLEADSAVLFLVGRKPKSAASLIQNPDNLYTISGAPVTDMTADTREAIGRPTGARWIFCSAA